MRNKRIVLWETVFLGFMVFVLTPAVEAPSAARAKNVPQPVLAQPTKPPVSLAKPNLAIPEKPLMVWECISGWYGEPFDGQLTANGEIYDMYGVSAAHPTLPMGSLMRVTNPRNQHSLIVRINDRGPYVDGRELDLSYEAARRLGFEQRGIARVKVELLEVPTRLIATQPD